DNPHYLKGTLKTKSASPPVRIDDADEVKANGTEKERRKKKKREHRRKKVSDALGRSSSGSLNGQSCIREGSILVLMLVGPPGGETSWVFAATAGALGKFRESG